MCVLHLGPTLCPCSHPFILLSSIYLSSFSTFIHSLSTSIPPISPLSPVFLFQAPSGDRSLLGQLPPETHPPSLRPSCPACPSFPSVTHLLVLSPRGLLTVIVVAQSFLSLCRKHVGDSRVLSAGERKTHALAYQCFWGEGQLFCLCF